MAKPPAPRAYVPQWELFIAREGDQCDSCGNHMKEGHEFYSDDRLRVNWRFCTMDCATTGVTAKSNKARFIGFVLGERNG